MIRTRVGDIPSAEGPPSDGRAFIAPPPRIPLGLGLGLRLARRSAVSDLLPAALLTWSPHKREMVVLAATCAQVNHWGRLVQGLGCAPAD